MGNFFGLLAALLAVFVLTWGIEAAFDLEMKLALLIAVLVVWAGQYWIFGVGDV